MPPRHPLPLTMNRIRHHAGDSCRGPRGGVVGALAARGGALSVDTVPCEGAQSRQTRAASAGHWRGIRETLAGPLRRS